MGIVSPFAWIYVMALILLFALEFFLCKVNSTIALVIPIIIACSFVFLGYFPLIVAAIMYTTFFVMRYIEKEKRKKLSELEKMNIKDL